MTDDATAWTFSADRTRQFDAVAVAYDRHRPPFPDSLFAALAQVVPDGGRIVEVGSGTGRATLPLARRGYRIVAIEPGVGLAAVARAKLRAFPDVRVEEARFEDWPGEEGGFDLVLAADAWHWVEPEAGARAAARLLRPGGRLAIAWSLIRGFRPAEFGARLEATWASATPNGARALQAAGDSGRWWLERLAESGRFEPAEESRHPLERRLTGRGFRREMATYGWVLGLPAAERGRLLDSTARLLDEAAGPMVVLGETVLYTARRR